MARIPRGGAVALADADDLAEQARARPDDDAAQAAEAAARELASVAEGMQQWLFTDPNPLVAACPAARASCTAHEGW